MTPPAQAGGVGRREKPITGVGPAADFGRMLRALRKQAGTPPYRLMADRCDYSASMLSRAASGSEVPPLDVVLAFVRVCGGDPDDWKRQWEHARRAEEAAALQLGGHRDAFDYSATASNRAPGTSEGDNGPSFDKHPPQDLPAEQSVLGGMMLSKDAIADVVKVLRPGDFYRPAHRNVYDCILDLYNRGEPADPITVAAELERQGQLRHIGGAPYLHTLIATVPTTANAAYFAEIVAEKAVLRRLVEAGTRIVNLGYSGQDGSDVNAIVDRAQSAIDEIAERHLSMSSLTRSSGTPAHKAEQAAPSDRDRPLSAVVLDAEPIVAEGLQSWLSQADPPIEVIDAHGELINVWTGLGAQADVVILDVRLMPDESGFDELRRLVENGRRVVIYTHDTTTTQRCLSLGAHVFLSKREGRRQIEQAVRSAARGTPYVPPSLASAISADDRSDRPQLTQREREVLLAWFRSSSKELAARQLNISPRTLNSHIERIRVKYAVAGRWSPSKAALMTRALEDGLITLTNLARTEYERQDNEGVLGLLLRSIAVPEADAQEKRITELYTKASEQLGSDKAAVRLGGLYAIARLAQDNPSMRQTIVNVLCAYLRMPYDLPGEPPNLATAEDILVREYREQLQEREVRLTAQRLLADHLDPTSPTDTFWDHIDLDLTRATLINLTLTNCFIHTANFQHATFIGPTDFGSARITDAYFEAAKFTGGAYFTAAEFIGKTHFGEATFARADFAGATFASDANFERVTFTGDANFAGATFASDANFEDVTFTGDANFAGTTFKGVWVTQTDTKQ